MPPPNLPNPPPIPAIDLLTFLFSEPPSEPDKALFISSSDPQNFYTYSQTLTLIKQLIAGLQAHPSFRPGGTVCIHSGLSPLYPVLILAIVAAGGVFTGTNPGYTPYELRHALRVTETRLVLCEPEDEILEPMTKAMATHDSLHPARDLLLFDTLPTHHRVPLTKGGLKSWRTLLSHGSKSWDTIKNIDELKSTTVALFLSSGTTGLPKAVPLTHHNLIAQHQFVYAPYTHLRTPGSPTCLPGYQPTKTVSGGVRMLIASPLFHIGAGNLTFVTGVKENRTSVLVRRFQVQNYLEVFERFECNEAIVVPPMAHAIVAAAGSRLSKQENQVRKQLRRWQYGIAGGAALDGCTQTRLQELTGRDIPAAAAAGGIKNGGRVSQLWGATELSCVVSCVPPDASITDEYMGKYEGSVGWTIKGMEMDVFDPTTLEPVAKGHEGEIWVRGASVMKGYFGGTPEILDTNKTTFVKTSDGKGRWIRTGDLGRQDPDTGLWFIVGRVKELIKVRGFQVSPPELEDVIRQMPRVADVAVMGLPSVRVGDGEVPAAFVVRTETTNQVTDVAVKKWVEERLSRYKWLEGGVRFVDAIPRNASGKILRRVLKEMVGTEDQSRAKGSKL